MKKLWVILFILFTSSLLIAQNRIQVAILEFSGEGLSTSEARIITSRFRSSLFETQKYTIVERSRMDEVLNEQGFQLTGCTSDECAIEAGKILGVRYILVGEVGKIGRLFTLSVRMINVESGKLLKIVTEDSEGSIEDFVREEVVKIAYSFAGKSSSVTTSERSDYLFFNPLFGINMTTEELVFGGDLGYYKKGFGRLGIHTQGGEGLISVLLQYGLPINLYKRISLIPKAGLGYVSASYYTDDYWDEMYSYEGLGMEYGAEFEINLPSIFSICIGYESVGAFKEMDDMNHSIYASIGFRY